MSEVEFTQLESYLFSQDKSEFITKLIANTDSYYYFSLLSALNKYGLNLPKEYELQFEKYKKFNTKRSQSVQLRMLFKNLENSKNQQEQKNIIQNINNNFFMVHFSHTQPTKITASNLSSQINMYSDELTEQSIALNEILQNAFSNDSNLNYIDSRYYTQLNIEKLKNNNEQTIKNFFYKMDESLAAMGEEVVEIILSYYKKQIERVKTYELEPYIFPKLSLEQLELLGKKLPDVFKQSGFVQELIMKKFQMDSSLKSGVLGVDQRKELQAHLKKILLWSRDHLPPKFESFSDQLLFEILQIGIDINEYDFDIFVQYLKNPKQNYSHSTSKQQTNWASKKKNYDQQWHQVHNLDINKWVTDDKLIETYLQKYFMNNESYQVFDEFLSTEYLRDLLYKVKLYKGDKIENITDILGSGTIKQMNDEKLINICPYNKQYFTGNEKVSLFVELKNIPSLIIKVFEFCAENYYIANQKELDNHINLDGLIAAEEQIFTFNQAPIIKTIQEFNFEKIQEKKQGIFIVEFIGAGLSSRAIIKKGKLVIREKLTIAGHAFQILDEDLQVCMGEKTGIWVQNRFHKASQDKGEIIIPFVSSSQNFNAVLIHNDFACQSQIILLPETYDFKCSFLYNVQSMLLSSKAKVLIQPRLFVNSVPVPLDGLKDTQVTVTIMNENQIPSTINFDKLKFTHKEELEVEFPITAKIHTITLNVSAKVKQMTSTTNKSLSNSHVITFNTGENEGTTFCALHLRNSEKKGYEIYLLGKNGEPKENIQITLNLRIPGITYPRLSTLMTNKEGKIVLGKLDNVEDIQATVQPIGDITAQIKQWIIRDAHQLNYTNHIRIIEGDKIALPYMGKDLNNKKLTFIKVFRMSNNGNSLFQIQGVRSTVISDELKSVKINNNSLIFENLKVGYYILHLKDINQKIDIEVLNGKYWNDKSLIVTQNALYDVKSQMNIIFLENIEQKIYEKKVEETKTGTEDQQQKQPEDKQASVSANKKMQIKMKIFSNHKELTRVHVFAFHYMPHDVNWYCDSLEAINKEFDTKIIPIVKSKNIYLNNKTLGDEYKYVLERKKQTRYVGNTLDKPQVLLKRTFLDDTNLKTESVAGEGTYKQQVQSTEDKVLEQEIIQNEAKLQQIKKQLNAIRMNTTGSQHYPQNVDTIINFLQYPAAVYANLRLDDQGYVTIDEFNYQDYSTLQVIATNTYTSVSRVIPIQKEQELQKNPVVFRDLTQKSTLAKDKFYSIFRNTQNLLEKQVFKNTDLTSTELQLVDSIPKLFTIQKELRKCFGTDTEHQNGYDFWEFLKGWESITLEEKHKKYDKYCCHELNLFIFCKDPAYFDGYVKPFLQNKIEKTFVDFFLLKMEDQLKIYCGSQKIQQLNALEKVLLVLYLKEKGLVEQAKEIVNLLESEDKIITYDTRTFKRYFDTVLNAKTEDGPSTQEQIQLLNQQMIQQMPINSIPISQPMMPSQINNRCNIQQIRQERPMIQQQAYFGNRHNQQFQQQPIPQQAYIPQISNCMPAPMMNMQIQQVQQQQVFQQQQQQQYNYDLLDMNMAGAGNFNNNATFGATAFDNNNNCNFEYNDDFQSQQYQEVDAYQEQQNYQQSRKQFVQQFKNLDKTKMYGERQYYKQKHPKDSKDLVATSHFWVDLAKHILEHGSDQPFLSSNFIYSCRNHTEMIAVLTFMGLPSENRSHKYTPLEGKGVEIEANGNLIVFTKEVREGKSDLKVDILVAQRFFDPKDRYIYSDEDPGVKFEKDIKEYIVNKVYGCQVIVTNCSITKHEFQVLVEIPEGSIPVSSNDYTKSHNIQLDSFTTKTIEYYFYFPITGNFKIYPANVARQGTVVAVAKPVEFTVLQELSKSTLETMDEILSKGSKEDILQFVATKNILNPNIFKFSDIYYLLKDYDFFTKFLEVLRHRKIYDQTSWSYSLMHGDIESFTEYLQSSESQNILKQFFKYINTKYTGPIFNVRNIEFHPLVNSRVHLLHNDKSNILNQQLRLQYQSFVEYLVEKPEYQVSDKLGLVYLFLLQDRIDDAIKIFGQITDQQLASSQDSRLQYDYFHAYLDLYIGFPNFKVARDLCEKYLDYPVISWRNLFYDIANKLAEYDGEEMLEDSEEKKKEEKERIEKKKGDSQNKAKNEINAQKEEMLTVELIDNNKLNITYQRIDQIVIKYYLIDLEVLFSRNPFLSSQGSEDFSYVQPNDTNQYNNLNQKEQIGIQKLIVQIPEKFEKENVFIQISSLNLKKSVMHFSTTLKVQIIENYGQVKVMDKDDKPLSRVYVKAFAKDNSSNVTFYKDGYTDLVGRFDYASLNTSVLQNVQKFSIFVMSDEAGSIIKESNPPSQIGRIEEVVELRGNQWNTKAAARIKEQTVNYEITQKAQNPRFQQHK